MPKTPASEQDFLHLIDAHFPTAHPHMRLGRGDDCAILTMDGPETVMTTDLFLEDVHFRRSYFSAADIGHKALAVNISDIAGMGCRPEGFSLGLIIPHSASPALEASFWDGLFSGMSALAEEHGIPLTGGDLSKGPCLGFSVTIWGAPGPTGRILTRETCAPGDAIFISGGIGLARAGLLALEADPGDAPARYPDAVAAHLRPRPRVAEGLALAGLPGVTALMDLSDGLARDLPRLTGPQRGARLALAPQHLHRDVTAYCQREGLSPEEFAILGGEDYALLGAVAPEQVPALTQAVPDATIIGTVTESPGLFLGQTPFGHAGFDHFSTSS
ncbi:thiamine-phosphate kinase [Desulfobaculum sp. SPO524]|uniref:thiamine-phosphate kinase n=1 Tax=Desulfobaculum sp. SPO524 TaxID=3378071 RepID=UPI0038542D76